MDFTSLDLHGMSTDKEAEAYEFCSTDARTLNCYPHFLEYLAITYEITNTSFLIYLDRAVVGLVPYFISEIPGKIQSFLGKENISQPILNTLLASQREIWAYVANNYFPSSSANYNSSLWKIPTNEVNAVLTSTSDNLLMNLKDLEMGGLKTISRGHKRTIEKSRSEGKTTRILDSQSPLKEILHYFCEYREAHRLAAGKQTRNSASFDYMKSLIELGHAKLFVAQKNGKSLSFLFCDYGGTVARGWSQANIQNLQHGEHPRHQLEFEAMVHFAKIGFETYHLGIDDSRSK